MVAKAFFMMRLNDHVQYLKKMDATLKGKDNFVGMDHCSCKLGKWLYNEGVSEVESLTDPRAKVVFDSLFEPHERFHTVGQEALAKKAAGDETGAQAALTELHTLSNTLANKLLELDKMK
ncbi:CZB domain-containing protein [Thioflexithrix psekupsensis]|uniref:Chemoreceptor zinc-binding domain-containing protein n=1 Tax=Thioflexithrix psekupsensis TaxID=1570016 RepID=A0A251X4Q5_9GAMM|nr:CZB domain-containing protein [Thioflexithrix psekupsensis]OUD12335.1 hypothetical protein TPSD3_14575 [Thioflexithrix psekupsensis]